MNHLEALHAAAGNRRYVKRKEALIKRLRDYAPKELTPHRFASLAAQIAHESGGFRHVKELWGPTRAQRGYEGRADLGNVRRGDGKKFMGHDLIQITGRANHRDLTKWVRETFNESVNFEENPLLLTQEKWLGIGALWYWTRRVDERFVEEGNQEMITRRINGGLNGYSDRLKRYDRTALQLLGMKSVSEFQRKFQTTYNLRVDGQSGPQTRAALHKALKELSAKTTTKKKTARSTKSSWWSRIFK